MTYDDWKTTDDTPEPEPPFNPCEKCGHETLCDCPCCNEYPDERASSLWDEDGWRPIG